MSDDAMLKEIDRIDKRLFEIMMGTDNHFVTLTPEILGVLTARVLAAAAEAQNMSQEETDAFLFQHDDLLVKIIHLAHMMGYKTAVDDLKKEKIVI